jgi:NitT/TauT family transport system ATP-binding protein
VPGLAPAPHHDAGPSVDPSGPRSAPAVGLSRVSKSFGPRHARVPAVEDVTLSVETGQFVTLIGPSGCGKTTLLRMVAGLLDPDEGEVSVFGSSVARAVAAKGIGLVPQSPALLPWRTVLDNVRLPLQVNEKAHLADGRVWRDPVEVLESFGLGNVLERRPAELSGGMQQRVAIARAFVFDPAVLLMDEPFAAVDELTREVLRHELLSVWQGSRKTVLFVTHSIAEAIALSDVVVIMSPHPGRVQKLVPIGLPRPRGDLVETTADFHELERQIRMEIRQSWKPGR